VHHAVLDRWSRGRSPLHARDGRVKVLWLVAFLAAVATTPPLHPLPVAGCALGAIATAALAGLPLGALLLRAAVVLPFSATFALISLLAGDAPRAAALVFKSYISAVGVLIIVGSTPFPTLLRSLERLRVPRFLVLVVQFLYRYLFVISEQAQHMRLAALSRGGWRFRLAAGAVAVLFARSYARAEGVHRAMLARGFQGQVMVLAPGRAGWKEWALLAGGLAVIVALRWGLEGLWSR
jgi:cobalt/nickel transport system permease protein